MRPIILATTFTAAFLSMPLLAQAQRSRPSGPNSLIPLSPGSGPFQIQLAGAIDSGLAKSKSEKSSLLGLGCVPDCAAGTTASGSN